MKRRDLLAATAGLVLAGGSLAQSGPIRRIGVLFPGGLDPDYTFPYRIDQIRRGLREGGYVEGRNVALVLRLALGHADQLPPMAADLVKLGVDLIVAASTPAALAAARATRTIPVVIVDPGDPVALGLAKSLGQPGGNVTGVISMAPQLQAKRLQLLKELTPDTRRVAVMANAAIPPAEVAVRELHEAAQVLGVALESVSIEGRTGMAPALEAAGRLGVPLLVFPDPLTFNNRTMIAAFAAARRLPVMYGAAEFTEAGGLISYGPDYRDMFRSAGAYAARILGGARPADLPFEQPTRFELVVNLKAARGLGLAIPPSTLLRADRVIE